MKNLEISVEDPSALGPEIVLIDVPQLQGWAGGHLAQAGFEMEVGASGG